MVKQRGESLKNVLLVDDDQTSLELYSHLMGEKTTARVVCTKYPTAALRLAFKHFFDLILIDVTMNYNGTPFGGLELYANLINRYGDSSLVAYSQYITDELLKQYNYNFNFIERGEHPGRFIEALLGLVVSLRKKQTCFVAMPFDKKYDAVFRVIRACVLRAGYCCMRVDQEHFTRSIVERVLGEIRKSKLMVFLATDQNPNALYECRNVSTRMRHPRSEFNVQLLG